MAWDVRSCKMWVHCSCKLHVCFNSATIWNILHSNQYHLMKVSCWENHAKHGIPHSDFSTVWATGYASRLQFSPLLLGNSAMRSKTTTLAKLATRSSLVNPSHSILQVEIHCRESEPDSFISNDLSHAMSCMNLSERPKQPTILHSWPVESVYVTSTHIFSTLPKSSEHLLDLFSTKSEFHLFTFTLLEFHFQLPNCSRTFVNS